jgi:hypothetical protein
MTTTPQHRFHGTVIQKGISVCRNRLRARIIPRCPHQVAINPHVGVLGLIGDVGLLPLSVKIDLLPVSLGLIHIFPIDRPASLELELPDSLLTQGHGYVFRHYDFP